MRRDQLGRVLSCIGRAMSTGGLSLVLRRYECQAADRARRQRRKSIERLLRDSEDPRKRIQTVIPSAEGTRYAFTDRPDPSAREETPGE